MTSDATMTQVGVYKLVGVGSLRREMFVLHIQASDSMGWVLTGAIRDIEATSRVPVVRRMIDGEWTDLDREGGDMKRAAMRLGNMREVSADWTLDELRMLIADKETK